MASCNLSSVRNTVIYIYIYIYNTLYQIKISAFCSLVTFLCSIRFSE